MMEICVCMHNHYIATQPGETMNPDLQDFLAHVVVDHIDGVMAELLIHQYFTKQEMELL